MAFQKKKIKACLIPSKGVLFLLLFAWGSCSKETNSNTQQSLPQVFIDTNGLEILDDPKIDGSITIQENGTTTYEGRIGIEIRGQSSQMFPKKQYGFETRNENNDDLDVSLLGFPEEEDWILHAPYSDKSLMRNALIYDLSRAIGRYTTRIAFVELNLNGSNDGLYILMEKLKRDDNRIDINKLKASENDGEDVTGGYIIKIDKENTYDGTNSFPSQFPPPNAQENQRVHYLYDTPDKEQITNDQRQYITAYVADFEQALASELFQDPQYGYNSYVEMDSFVDFFLLNELANNVDGYRLSTWIIKDKNMPLAMGPIWDFNLAFGNADYCNGGNYNVWAYRFNERCPNDQWQIPFWWQRLLEDPAFVAKTQNRWKTLRSDAFSEASIFQRIDSYASLFRNTKSGAANFDRWPVLGTYIWPNNYIGASYQDEINYLKNWISNRLLWLDENINLL